MGDEVEPIADRFDDPPSGIESVQGDHVLIGQQLLAVDVEHVAPLEVRNADVVAPGRRGGSEPLKACPQVRTLLSVSVRKALSAADRRAGISEFAESGATATGACSHD